MPGGRFNTGWSDLVSQPVSNKILKHKKTTHELNLFILFIIEITSISMLQVQFIEQA